MPRTKKEAENNEKLKVSSSATKKATSKKSTKAKVSKNTPKKKVATKKVKAEPKKSTTSKTSSKAKTVKATSKAKKSKVKSKVTSVKKVVKASKKIDSKENKEFANVLEYYDLPYRYNETIVRILAQTPNVLFVYWDISDSDRNRYIEKYGEYFFNDTYPVLIVHNKTLNYTQEVEINDFANSWYISISDPRSEYSVELCRRFKDYAKRNPSATHKEDFDKLLYVSTSNNLVMPNDRVLLDEVKPLIKYRNVKTNEESYKSIINILKNNNYNLLDFYNLYKNIYQVEDLNSLFTLSNPSSGNPTSTFK